MSTATLKRTTVIPTRLESERVKTAINAVREWEYDGICVSYFKGDTEGTAFNCEDFHIWIAKEEYEKDYDWDGTEAEFIDFFLEDNQYVVQAESVDNIKRYINHKLEERDLSCLSYRSIVSMISDLSSYDFMRNLNIKVA